MINLHYVERGQGPVLLFVHGWSQSTRCFEKQLADLSDRYRVMAVDMRGHGESPKPSHGYRVARLAQDLHEFLVQHDLREVALAGHSMGASIIWSYVEQFGAERLAKLIFIDQAPLVTNGMGPWLAKRWRRRAAPSHRPRCTRLPTASRPTGKRAWPACAARSSAARSATTISVWR
jgi:pimeloyl-ACP methyl ester carboxylesterase